MGFSAGGAATGAAAGAVAGPIGMGIGAIAGGFLGGGGGGSSAPSSDFPTDNLTNSTINFGDPRISNNLTFNAAPGNSATELLAMLTGGNSSARRYSLNGGSISASVDFPMVPFLISTAATIGLGYGAWVMIRRHRKAA